MNTEKPFRMSREVHEWARHYSELAMAAIPLAVAQVEVQEE